MFTAQSGGGQCPLRSSNFQLARNFLFAAAFAAKERKQKFGLLVVCSKACDEKVKEQLEEFRSRILSEKWHEQILLVHYEQWIEILRASAHPVALELARFLAERIKNVLRQ